MILISSLEYGGAERQVVELIKQFDRKYIDPIVCSLSDYVPLASTLPNPEDDLIIVKKTWKYDITTIFRVARLMKEKKIDVVHAFLFDAEIVARLAARWVGVPIVVGSERNSNYHIPFIQKVIQQLTKSWLTGLIANSNAGKRFVKRTLGLTNESVYVVHNGIDVEKFKPDNNSGRHIRKELGIGFEEKVIGMIASFKKQKRHDYFLQIARTILDLDPKSWFIMVGEPLRDNQQGAKRYHKEIRQMVDNLKIGDRCLFLGSRNDMSAIYNACDVTVLTSSREGTPNVLLESMACGIPVVASDIADNANIVSHGKSGYIAKCGNVSGFSNYIQLLLKDRDKRMAMGEVARNWVASAFSTTSLARKTERVYIDLMERKGIKICHEVKK